MSQCSISAQHHLPAYLNGKCTWYKFSCGIEDVVFTDVSTETVIERHIEDWHSPDGLGPYTKQPSLSDKEGDEKGD